MKCSDKNKKVTINIISVQSVDNQSEKTTLMTQGKMSRIPNVENGYALEYDESEATGFAGLKTLITCIGTDYASMERNGENPTNLIIEKNKKNHCIYNTPYGSLNMGIFTHDIKNNMTDNGGKIYFKYTLDINSSYLSDNEVYIDVKTN